MWAKVQNSTAVLRLNFSNNTSFSASISRPNAKPRNVVCHLTRSNNSNYVESSTIHSLTLTMARNHFPQELK